MRNQCVVLTTVLLVFTGIVCPKPVLGAEGTDKVSALEQRIQSLEKQLTELKTLLEDQKKAQTEKPAAPKPAAEEKPGPKLVGPPGKIEVGGDIRWRGRFFDNLFDFNNSLNDRSQTFRFRPRVYVDWQPNDEMEAYVRFTKEWLYGQDNEMPGYEVEAKDVMFDNAWGEVKNILGSGLSLRVGRQDLIYGEGFVLLDGTPQDGSQTTSFDAAKLTYTHDWGTTDLLYAKLYEYNNYNSDDEDMYGVYNKWKIGDFGLEPYLLVREKRGHPNEKVIASGYIDPFTYDPSKPITPKYTFSSIDPSPAQETVLLGMRGTRSFEVANGVKLALAAEGGKEWGTVDFTGTDTVLKAFPGFKYSSQVTTGEVDRDAWGGYFHGTLSFDKVAWKPSFKAGVTVMSGDDPNTRDYEGWDDFYGEWPKYSELYIYSIYDGFKTRTSYKDPVTGKLIVNDPDIGAWSNMYMPEVVFTVQPTDKMKQTLRYLFFGAMEETGPGGGSDRGHNLQWLTEYTFTKNLSGHVLVEWFSPGNFYGPGADEAWFARFQLMYKF